MPRTTDELLKSEAGRPAAVTANLPARLRAHVARRQEHVVAPVEDLVAVERDGTRIDDAVSRLIRPCKSDLPLAPSNIGET